MYIILYIHPSNVIVNHYTPKISLWQEPKIKTSKDAFENNVIEPYLVVKTTLENAISVASTILTTNCVILNI